MRTADLDFTYPEQLVATEPQRPSRVCFVEGDRAFEISIAQLLQKIPPGDVLVVNNTKVLKRRVFAGDLEILFLRPLGQNQWEVLFPSKKYPVGASIDLPFGTRMSLLQKGRPQIVQIERELTDADFEAWAELPLPPYIQKARAERHNVAADESWYQTAWAAKPGSLAAPTASLHFSASDIESLKTRAVQVLEVTLHVGLGTFLPVTTEDLDTHQMHEEWVEISTATWEAVQAAKKQGRGVWAMGTTAVRALESAAVGKLGVKKASGFMGPTNLLIQPGYQWQIVDHLLTNFHQPMSTLLALVAAFSDLTTVKSVYKWAIEKQFRLFSYGDLSVWNRK